MSKVTGYKIRESLKVWTLELESSRAKFKPSLRYFEGEDEEKRDPMAIADSVWRAERAIAALQTAQARYNLGVTIDVKGQFFTLLEAVKLVGGAGRQEKLWREATAPKKKGYYEDEADYERDPEKVRSLPAITEKAARRQWGEQASLAAALRAGISQANSTELEIEDLGLHPDLLR